MWMHGHLEKWAHGDYNVDAQTAKTIKQKFASDLCRVNEEIFFLREN